MRLAMGDAAASNKMSKFKPAIKVLSAVCALVGAAVLFDGGGGVPNPTRMLRELRELCEDIAYKHGDEPFGVWQELYKPDYDYYSLERITTVVPRENDVAFVVTLLDCPERPAYELPGVPEDAPDNEIFYDHMTMLKWHICDECGTITIGANTYNATTYAIMAGSGIECMGSDGVIYDRVKVLEELGFIVKILGSPVESEEIVDPYLKDNVETDVGLKDLIRLQAYNLTDHPLVVMLDYETAVLQPLNTLFEELSNSNAPAAITMDYSPVGVIPTPVNHGVNMGFVVVKPSSTELENIIDTYKNTAYHPTLGWNSGGIGGFPGAMGSSGILAYYYSNIADPTALVLDKCLYNNDNESPTEFNACRDGAATCSNCQETDFLNVYAARLSDTCGKPYDCPDVSGLPPMCEKIHNTWFEKRLDYHNAHLVGGPASRRGGKFQAATFLEYCHGPGRSGYEKVIEDSEAGVTPEAVAHTPDIPTPEVIGTISCETTCPAGQFVTPQCTCTEDECDACPERTRCQRSANGQPPMCIDCECGFCDKNGAACCDFNGVNNCKSATNKNECAMQNAYFPGWPGTGNACSGVEISATAVPNGCGCQPNELTPCTYVPSLREEDDKCFIVRAHELLSSKHSEMNSDSMATAVACAECVAQCEGGACIHGDGQTDVDKMQSCLGRTIGKKREACRTNCGSKCIKIDNEGAVIPPGNAFGYETQYT